jgi:16S rRNA (adenine1518-N6/adenine1519-N6)-dimethyltransferase
LTPTEARRLLDEYGLAPRRSAGQNLVVDPNTVERIVAAARLDEHDTVVEFGPGLGSLTLAMADAVHRVVAIEIDAGFVDVLRDRVAGRSDIEVVHADALQVDLDELVGDGPARLVANLPYNVATPMLVHALASPSIMDAFVMVQREVGERWCAPPGDRLRAGISVKLELVAEVEIAFTVPRTVFLPVPNVDSVMVRARRRGDAPDAMVQRAVVELVEAAFAQRRKTLRNTLRRILDIEVLEEAASIADVDLGARAETLSTAAFVRLAAAVSEITARR